MSTIGKIRKFLSRLFSFIGFRGRQYTPQTMNEMIWYAILGRRLLEFDYDGYHRIVEPHVYGRKFEKDGIMTYQIDGQSSSGGLPDWRRMKLKGITNMKVLDKTFLGRRPVNGMYSSWDIRYLIVAW